MLSYCLMVGLVEVGRPAPDVVVGSTVHPFAALTGWYIARRRGARFIYEVRDLWPQTMIDVGEMGASSLAARGLYGLEAFLTRRADVVLTVLPGMTDYLASRGLPTEHVVYLPNGPDLSEFDEAARDTTSDAAFDDLLADLEARRQAGEVVFVYAGAHGLVNRLDVIVDATSRLQERGVPVHVLFVGDGPEKPALVRSANDRGLRSVRFVDAIPKGRIPRLLAAADVGLLHYTRSPVYAYGISFNKLFDYMAARLPAIFACESVNDPIAASGGGLSIAPDDPSALADAMAALVERGPVERQRMGAAARAWVEEHHDMGRLSARFLEVVGMNAGGGQPAMAAKVA
jgi:glycosyltransferase involved in cell wall biosynthesis